MTVEWDGINTGEKSKSTDYKVVIRWDRVVYLSILHCALLYWIYLLATLQIHFSRLIFHYIYMSFTAMGIGPGAHRLWSHRSYKAKLPLRIILMLCNSANMQSTIYIWARDHRVHHKFVDTDADPYNAKRGFFFSHVGWLMCNKHPDVHKQGKKIDMSDIENDIVIQFQNKHFLKLYILMGLVVPIAMHWLVFDDPFWVMFLSRIGMTVVTLNFTWSVNSIAHIWGMRPYNKNITPAENKLVSYMVYGEGFHNYHHVFPWDYKTSELGGSGWNIATGFIEFFHKIGWAYDLKTVSDDMVLKRKILAQDEPSRLTSEVS